MSLSRRQFLSRTSLSAAALPALMSAGSAHGDARGAFDFSMGFPPDAVRLNFNENTLGPSAKAIEGAKAALAGSYRYALSPLLRPLIAERHRIDKEWVLMGNGSTEVLTLVPIAFMRNGGNVVAALETWDGMLSIADNMGVTVKRIKLLEDQGYAYDVEAMLAAIDAQTRLLMVISPNNPTGSVMGYPDLVRLADALPKGALLVLDEAYCDYLPDGKTGIDLIREGRRNVLVTRTFSKAHALAGLRCGYGIGHPDILKEITKFGCGMGSINMAVFGAVQGSLADPQHIERSRAHVREARSYYQQQCRKMGLEMVAGPSPFALINVGASRSKAIKDELQRRKIFVTHGAGWQLADYLRVSYGRDEENRIFFAQLATLV